MKNKVINHGSRHRPSWGRRKFRELRDSGDDGLVLLRKLDEEQEWDDWSYLDYECGETCFEDEYTFGLHRDGSAELLGGLLTGDELQRLLEPTLWQRLKAIPLDDESFVGEIDEEWESLPSDELIEALLARCQQLRVAKHWHDLITVPDEDLKALRSFWRASDARLTAATAPQGYCLPYQLGLVAMLEPFWLRPAASWQRPDGDDRAQFASLLEHLFVRYPVPRFLLEGVDWVADRFTWKWLLWLVLMGSGASMVRAGRRIGWWVNSAFLGQLMSVPAQLDATSACTWAEVLRLGGSETLADALCNDPSFRLDPTEVDMPDAPRAEPLLRLSDMQPWQVHQMERGRAEHFRFRQFWQATVEWLVRNESGLPLEQLGHILAWANHEFTEQQRASYQATDANETAGQPQIAAPAFSWKGRTLAATMRAANEYQERLRRRRGPNQHWTARGWDWQATVETNVIWSVHELISSDELYDEGDAMHHCVGAYDWHCVAGDSAIFSLRRDGFRILTIEIDSETRDIRQAYGACNRRATPTEMEVVYRWRVEAVNATLA